MPTVLFHRDVYAPKNVFSSPGRVRVRYGQHAKNAAASDRYGNLTRYLNEWLTIHPEEIVEVELTDGKITKRVVRHQVTPALDVVLVVGADGFVRTVWGNLHSDHHATLDRTKFVHPAKATQH